MKKSGFTLAELIITLTIIGVASALIVPALSDLIPDKNKAKVLRYYAMIGSAVDGMLSDENLYHPYTVYNDALGKYTKSCDGLACIGSAFTTEFKKHIGIDSNGTTSDGSKWAILGDMSYTYEIRIDIDASKPNNVYPSTSATHPKKATSFRFKIDKYGTVMPADPLTDAYLLNPYKTNDRKTDFEKAINFKSKSY